MCYTWLSFCTCCKSIQNPIGDSSDYHHECGQFLWCRFRTYYYREAPALCSECVNHQEICSSNTLPAVVVLEFEWARIEEIDNSDTTEEEIN